MEDKSKLYRIFREYGFASVFFIHLIWYSLLLYIIVNGVVLNQLMVRMSLDLSFIFLVTMMIIMQNRCMEDINVRFFDICLSTVITRGSVRIGTYFGLTDPYWILAASLGIFTFFTLALILKGKYKTRYGYRIVRALFP